VPCRCWPTPARGAAERCYHTTTHRAMATEFSIAHYRVTAKRGEGGMGAVYRALDTKLNREVAIKVLPDSVAGKAERLLRFTREAKVLASLNHPNIAIYGIEERSLVMELVVGETLRGPARMTVSM
jgi:serine/threonine protein kinase